MRRIFIAALFSAIVHAALLLCLSGPTNAAKSENVMRVTFAAAVKPEQQAPPQKQALPKPPAPKETPKPIKPAPKPKPVKPAKQITKREPVKTPAPDTTDAADETSPADPDESPQTGGTTDGTPVVAPGGAPSSQTPAVVDVSSLLVTKKVTPDYPMISRKRGDHGTVVLLAEIKSGRVASVRVERSSGHPPLDDAASRAVRSWEFDVSGYGDTVTARVPFVFSLR
ncbi:hypothetical protein FACS1894216_20670 [Synergistales bacterium]|nr:hypothetical protein FACS1894216_20670 [Synergistales bacterium]